jgi:hypothetical protein
MGEDAANGGLSTTLRTSSGASGHVGKAWSGQFAGAEEYQRSPSATIVRSFPGHPPAGYGVWSFTSSRNRSGASNQTSIVNERRGTDGRKFHSSTRYRA